MIIPGLGIIVSFITFPGVIVHEMAHQFFCRLFKVPVFDVCYFRLGNPSGYVIHEMTDNAIKNLFISIGPFLLNTIMGIIITFPASVSIITFEQYDNYLSLIMMWLGISILMHAFPSSGDAKALFSSIIKNNNINILIKIIVAPIILIIYIGSIGSIVWLDLIYAVTMSLLLPEIVAKLII